MRVGNAPCTTCVRIFHDSKPRTAPMARRRDGDIAPYRNGTEPRGTGGAHDAKPRTAVASRAPRQRRGGAMGTSRPTAKPHDHETEPRGTATVRMMAMPCNVNAARVRARGMRPRARAVRTTTWHGDDRAYRRKQGDKLEGKFCLKGKDQFGRIAPTNAPERCLSGLRCLTRNQVYRKVPGVRIPLSPPFFLRVFH